MDGSHDERDDSLCHNDVHSRLNPTRHRRIVRPQHAEQIAEVLFDAQRLGESVAVAGAQHAMGGQQFLADGCLIDTSALDGILDFDSIRGLVRVAAGTHWPALQTFLRTQRDANGRGWAIRQKQTGADDFSLGGALAVNIHGRGLDFAPFVDDLEAFTLVRPDGAVVEVDRIRQPELFALAVGGYGLFGVVVDLTLRLAPRHMLERRVRLLRRAELIPAFDAARSEGATYGDFQFSIDSSDEDFLDLGVFACYHPLPEDTPATTAPLHLQADDWQELLLLAHTDKREAFKCYSQFYLASNGQHYGSDDHQFGVYLDGYHAQIDRVLGHVGSEMITELYVPRADLDAFLGLVADDCRRHAVDVIYGTVRLIREDRETVLAWARQDWACVVFNLHVRHDAEGRRRLRMDAQRLIDRALGFGGSFYLTYHREARADQLIAAYPRLREFMGAKHRLDPSSTLESEWYRALRATLAAA
jgi:FAD/FMN-containing dehydrogenase